MLTLVLTLRCPGELAVDELIKALRAETAAFEPVDVHRAGVPVPFQVKLGESSVMLGDDQFDGFCFTAPEGASARDFIWYFNVPEAWGHWYIVPVDEDMKPGFRNWLAADKIYQGMDNVGEHGRLRVFQQLSAGYFVDGRKYLMWFHRVRDEPLEAVVKGRLMFVAAAEDEWAQDDCEKALGLAPFGPEHQVKHLGSRGGEILLDQEFFTHSYAVERIESVFTSIRRTQSAGGGFFITMETAVPPCGSEPSFAAIRARYGDPDLIISGSEERKCLEHAGQDVDEDHDDDVMACYYDHFVLEVGPPAQGMKVTRVRTQADSLEALREVGARPCHVRVPMKNLSLFYDGAGEVGRFYQFLDEGATPLCIQEPPPGTYHDGDGELVYHGDGKWDWLRRYPDGKIAQEIPLERHRCHGPAKGYSHDGRLQYEFSFVDGLPHGEFIRYAEDGSVEQRLFYENGRRIDSDE